MKVLFVSMRWDYKDPSRGDSFEYANFWDALDKMDGVDAELFPMDEKEKQLGRVGMNQALLDRVGQVNPDLVFFFLFTDELDLKTISSISAKTTTVNWFTDDHWRFDDFSSVYAEHLTWVATTHGPAVDRYRALGHNGVIRTQWGCNTNMYRPMDVPRDIDASFIGLPHGDRRSIIEFLRNHGVEVRTWGAGWETGRLEQAQMIETFSRTKVNLNLSNASVGTGLVAGLKMLMADPSMRKMLNPKMIKRNLKRRGGTSRPDQIKGRNFEIPGCRTFLLTSQVSGLEEYFVPGKEISTFDGREALLDKIRYYLVAEDEREEVAVAGYERVLRDHTYELRFRQMFEQMGLT